MNPEKKLKRIVSESGKELRKKDKAFRDKVVQEHYRGESALRRFVLGFPLALLCSVALCFGLVWITYSSMNGEPTPQPPIYYMDNEVSEVSTLEDFTADTPNVSFDFGDGNVSNVTLYYDSLSGDKLYYTLYCENNTTLEYLNLTVIINEYYESPNNLDSSSEKYYTEDILGITFECMNNGIDELTGTYSITASAEDVGGYGIKINYATYFPEYRDMFAQFVESLIDVV